MTDIDMRTPEEWLELQLAEARKLGDAELARHALVSIRHHCRCRQCACCAAAQVQRDRRMEASNEATRKMKAEMAAWKPGERR